MFVSESQKIAFIHIQKTAGSTIVSLLQEQVPDLKVIGSKHNFARYGLRNLPDWEAYFSFAFVRNPWDRMVSWYTMIDSAGQVTWTDILKSPNIKKMLANFRRYRQTKQWSVWRHILDNKMSFEEFILNSKETIKGAKGGYTSIAYNQLDYLTDEADHVIVDFIGRLENFQADLQVVLEHIGIDSEKLRRPNRKSNPSRHKHYSRYYTPETRAAVAGIFRRDIEYFGYTFEEEQ